MAERAGVPSGTPQRHPHSPRLPPMSRMQIFSNKASVELDRLADAAHNESAFFADSDVLDSLPETYESQLQEALACLLRAERAFDFQGVVRDVEDAVKFAAPEDVERVAIAAAAASRRRRVSARAITHEAHITDIFQEAVPGLGRKGERAMEVIGYVGMTGRPSSPH